LELREPVLKTSMTSVNWLARGLRKILSLSIWPGISRVTLQRILVCQLVHAMPSPPRLKPLRLAERGRHFLSSVQSLYHCRAKVIMSLNVVEVKNKSVLRYMSSGVTTSKR
jgi:hypothetical protein